MIHFSRKFRFVKLNFVSFQINETGEKPNAASTNCEFSAPAAGVLNKKTTVNIRQKNEQKQKSRQSSASEKNEIRNIEVNSPYVIYVEKLMTEKVLKNIAVDPVLVIKLLYTLLHYLDFFIIFFFQIEKIYV